MPRAPRIPRAQVLALSQPDPVLAVWRPWLAAAAGVALLLAALLS